MLVIHNTQHPAYTLKKKKIIPICYHAVCESVAMGESLTGNMGTNDNCSDLTTNVLYGGNLQFHLSNLLYDIYDDIRKIGRNLRSTQC